MALIFVSLDTRHSSTRYQQMILLITLITELALPLLNCETPIDNQPTRVQVSSIPVNADGTNSIPGNFLVGFPMWLDYSPGGTSYVVLYYWIALNSHTICGSLFDALSLRCVVDDGGGGGGQRLVHR